jgi:hypothetical protein
MLRKDYKIDIFSGLESVFSLKIRQKTFNEFKRVESHSHFNGIPVILLPVPIPGFKVVIPGL